MNLNAQTPTLTEIRDARTDQELELENARLQKLVADLLVRNQQLRLELKIAQRVFA